MKDAGWEHKDLQVGDMISIPSWNTYGMVVGHELPTHGSDAAQLVLLQEVPDSPKVQRYHLEPGDYIIEDRA